ncbi:hypothetical protein [Pararobbsia alpina]
MDGIPDSIGANGAIGLFAAMGLSVAMSLKLLYRCIEMALCRLVR